MKNHENLWNMSSRPLRTFKTLEEQRIREANAEFEISWIMNFMILHEKHVN